MEGAIGRASPGYPRPPDDTATGTTGPPRALGEDPAAGGARPLPAASGTPQAPRNGRPHGSNLHV
ncbi:hypothetical protein GCM10010466_66380 [Planomonospora alba]|uniref:Uncharacterized protein n=1 Tax=Planomonospora alba TaxID=161354 RepID=A0ABP6P3W2_9ACTN